ncbi:hypothetical protein I316_03690 [Kwoniella heveanensis BCC8398]|uniref:Restriction of telomere capping protein 4 n=1 Tax=Kwoniella heveanensis BCC8398 TaxID=1296120 RepID=A0A1B9GUG3_9TREE|nr:hypothetical protein I316_03690 [Kwoniella heveanensis BCC8398]
MDFFGGAAAAGRSRSNTVVSKPKVKKGEKPILATTSSASSQVKAKEQEKEKEKEKEKGRFVGPSSSTSDSRLALSPGKGPYRGNGKISAKGRGKERGQQPLVKETESIERRNPSVNAEEVFRGMRETERDVDNIVDRYQWRQKQANGNGESSSKPQEKKNYKKKNVLDVEKDDDGYYLGRASGSGSGTAGGRGQLSSQNGGKDKGKAREERPPYGQSRTTKASQDEKQNIRRRPLDDKDLAKSRSHTSREPQSLIPNSGSESDSNSPSTSDDELSMGHTPDRHKHAGYRADETLRKRDKSSATPMSSPPKFKYTRHTKDQGGLPTKSHLDSRNDGDLKGSRFKAKREEVIIPSSQSGQTLNDTPRRPKLKKRSGTGKKRSSDELDSSDEDRLRSRDLEKRRKRAGGHGQRLATNGEDATPRPSQKLITNVGPQSRKNNRRVTSPDQGSISSPNPDPEKAQVDEDVNGDDSPMKVEWKYKRESPSAGHKFFDDLVEMASNDGDDVDYDILADQGEMTVMLEDLDDDEDVSKEDKAFLATCRSLTEQCPYCSEPMPSKPSKYLTQLQDRLEEISTPCPTESNPSARNLPWQQHIDFCNLHRAETSLIPLGIRDGYPETIDFLHLEERLEKGWIRLRLDEIVRNPQRSKVFRRVQREVEEVGKNRWGGIKFQSKEENIAAVKPGYYGDLGRAIMIDHFLNLRKWGHFPSLKSSTSSSQPQTSSQSAIAEQHNPLSLEPLSWHDFISHVLVPESSILLIMEDRRYSSLTDQAYKEAERVRSESVKYGTWKFREEGDEAEEILAELRGTVDVKRKRLRKIAVGLPLQSSPELTQINQDQATSGKATTVHEVQDEDEATPKPVKIRKNGETSTSFSSRTSRKPRSRTHSAEPNSSVSLLGSSPPPIILSKGESKKHVASSSSSPVDDDQNDSNYEDDNKENMEPSKSNNDGDGKDDEGDGIGTLSGSQQSDSSSQFYGEDLNPDEVIEALEYADRVSGSAGTSRAK